MKTLAIIPARSGSKSIPQKNIAPLGEQRLIDYTFEAAINSTLIGHVYFASDYLMAEVSPNKELLNLRKFNYTELSDALTAGDVQVDEAILATVRDLNWEYDGELLDFFDTLIVLQPTSPFRTSEHIDEALSLYNNLNSVKKPWETKDNIISVWEPGWPYEVGLGGYVYAHSFNPSTRLGRQDVDSMSVAMENGAIYIVDLRRFMRDKTFRSEESLPFYMDKVSSIEIDEPIDLVIAEAVLAYENNS